MQCNKSDMKIYIINDYVIGYNPREKQKQDKRIISFIMLSWIIQQIYALYKHTGCPKSRNGV